MRDGSRGEYVAALGLAWLSLSDGSCLLRLLKEAGVEAVWRASRRRLLDWGIAERAIVRFQNKRDLFDVAGAEAVLQRTGLRFLPLGSRLYPPEFHHLDFPPAGLFVRANEEALEHMVAAPRATVVGTRKASGEGLRATDAFVSVLSGRGIVIVSGMALGIDAEAHRIALETGGSTVAVLGCGADIVYPRCHQSLYVRIGKMGVIASELPPGASPSRWTFPHRNRLLAALGDAVMVIEGSITSGALQTAKWALDLGRPVFSVPGSIFKEGSGGCNMLVYDGAIPALKPETLVEDFLLQTRIERGKREVPDCVPWTLAGERATIDSGVVVTGRGRLVLEALGSGPSTVDGLVGCTGLPVREVSAALGELEAVGQIARGAPGTYARAP